MLNRQIRFYQKIAKPRPMVVMHGSLVSFEMKFFVRIILNVRFIFMLLIRFADGGVTLRGCTGEMDKDVVDKCHSDVKNCDVCQNLNDNVGCNNKVRMEFLIIFLILTKKNFPFAGIPRLPTPLPHLR